MKLSLDQKQLLNHQQLQSVALLQMNHVELEHYLRELAEENPPTAPLSDQKLAEIMLQQGCELSRRTVAKYREELGIPNAFARKKHDTIPEPSQIPKPSQPG